MSPPFLGLVAVSDHVGSCCCMAECQSSGPCLEMALHAFLDAGNHIRGPELLTVTGYNLGKPILISPLFEVYSCPQSAARISKLRRERSLHLRLQTFAAYKLTNAGHAPSKTKLLRIMTPTSCFPPQLQEEGLRTFTAYLRGQVSARAKENFEALVVAMDRPVVKGAGPDFVGVLTELFKVGTCL